MMNQSTYILFDGDCKPAFEFYKSIFGGELILTTVGDSPMKNIFPPSAQARVVNAKLTNEFINISASDWLHPTDTPLRGNMMCLYISGGTVEKTTEIFKKLSTNALVTDELKQHPFGLYGALNDQFGIRWMFHANNE